MHAGELYQYDPYVTIYLLAETHVLRVSRRSNHYRVLPEDDAHQFQSNFRTPDMPPLNLPKII